jgi:hypothetical protein
VRSLALDAVIADLGKDNCRTALTLLSEMVGVERQAIVDCLELLNKHGETEDGERVVAYTSFYRPKKSGGRRLIIAPVDEIKELLRKVKNEILCRWPLPRFIHGYRTRRSWLTNAKVHFDAGAEYAINLDIENCFPSTPIGLVRRVYWQTAGKMLNDEGLSAEVVRAAVEILTALSTLKYGRSKVPVLPVGSPTSPALLNLALTPAYIRTARALKCLEGEYAFSGYGDDWTVSSPAPLPPEVKLIIMREWQRLGYRPNRSKTRMMRRDGSGPPIEVTGLILGKDRILLPDDWLQRTELLLIAYAGSPRCPGDKTRRSLQSRISMVRKLYGVEMPGRVGNCFKSLIVQAESNLVMRERLTELLRGKMPEVSEGSEEAPESATERAVEQDRDWRSEYGPVPQSVDSHGQFSWDFDGGPGGVYDPFVPGERQPEQGDWEGE